MKKKARKTDPPLWLRPGEWECPLYHKTNGNEETWFKRYAIDILPTEGLFMVKDPVLTLTLPMRLPSTNHALLWHPMQASHNKKLIHQAMYLAATSVEGFIPDSFGWYEDEGCPTKQTLWTYEEFASRYVKYVLGWKRPSPAWTIMEFYGNEDGTKSLHIQTLCKRTTDADAIFPKAAIDGLRKAMIIPDDDRKHIRSITYDWMEWQP